MALYESVFIMRQDISSSQAEAMADEFAAIIEQQGGSLKRREYWGLKSLSYRIRKNRKGHYVLFDMEAPSEAVQEMERLMRLNEDVLRHLTLRIEEVEEGPSAMMQSRRGRGDRDRGDRGDRDRGDRGDRDRGDRGDRGDRERRPRPEAEGGA